MPAKPLLQKTPFSFDVSVWEILWPLAVGARLAIAAPGRIREPGFSDAVIASRCDDAAFRAADARAFHCRAGGEALRRSSGCLPAVKPCRRS